MELANWNKIKAKRFELNVEGYTETDGEEPYFLTPYFGVLPENVDNKAKSKLKKNSLHQAYYVEQPAFSTVPATIPLSVLATSGPASPSTLRPYVL